MTITSTAFENYGPIPRDYTCEGNNYSPPLTFSQTPKEAQSLALIVEDPDSSNGTFIHWILYNIPPSTLQLLKNQVPTNSIQGMTDFGKASYGGPCPASGTHRYFFKLFALDTVLNMPSGVTKKILEEKMKGHILDTAELIGLYLKHH